MGQARTATTSQAKPAPVAGYGPRPADPLRTLRPLIILAGVVIVTVVLYFGRAVLIPLGLAALLAFLLTPVVDGLQRRGVGRVTSVVIVVVLLFSLLLGFAWTLVAQITSLGNELPKYRGNIRAKIADLQGARKDTAIDKLQREAQVVIGEIQKEQAAVAGDRKPIPVVVENPSVLWRLPDVLEYVASAGLVLVLVVFILLRREELRNRIIRLAGYRRLPAATRALDEASGRVSRYLLTQSIINSGFGVAVAIGLFLIGLPYAFLWGFLAACLRFIPYVGTWMAAALPIVLSLAVFQGWQRPLLVVALFLVLEPLIYLVLEPLLYGHSAGVSEVALLTAVAFWTWIWGPVGLVLATPLTVCLVVFARHVTALEFVVVLMGDEPVLETRVSFYQRLLATDQDEAMDLLEAEMKGRPREQAYDELLIPALSSARCDRISGRLSEGEERAVVTTALEIIDDLDDSEDRPETATPGMPCVVACPAHDGADVAALAMLRNLLASRCQVEIVSAHLLTSEITELVERTGAPVVVVAALPPAGLARARYLCKRLRTRLPDLRILVGRWRADLDEPDHAELLQAAGADAVHASLLETRTELWRLVAPAAPAPPAETVREVA